MRKPKAQYIVLLAMSTPLIVMLLWWGIMEPNIFNPMWGGAKPYGHGAELPFFTLPALLTISGVLIHSILGLRRKEL